MHQRAWCESSEIGEGTRVWAFSHVQERVRVGKNCNIGEHVFVENNVTIGNHCTIKNGVALCDGVTLEDGVFVGPYVVFTNDLRPRAFRRQPRRPFVKTQLNRGSSVGANATIVCGITLGEFCMVGAGSVVLRDVAPHALVVGNPARPVARICFCGERLQHNVCPRCGTGIEAGIQFECAFDPTRHLSIAPTQK